MKLDSILKMSQKELKVALKSELSSMGYHVCVGRGFLYAKGTVPVLLVAHLDTVHSERVKTICRSGNGNILMSPQGIGGDDRAGVFMVLQIARQQRCHILFCEDEEAGGIGARAFTKSGFRPNVNFIVELDRRGSRDAVFYDCENPEFTAYVCGFGFSEAFGSFSDISVIAPCLGVAAVNISAGYYNEHTTHEHIRLSDISRNVNLVREMVTPPHEKYEYIEASYIEPSIRYLSPAPDFSYITTKGGVALEGGDRLYVDMSGRPYEYYDELDIAVELTGFTALTTQGLPVRYDSKSAVVAEVVPIENVDMYL